MAELEGAPAIQPLPTEREAFSSEEARRPAATGPSSASAGPAASEDSADPMAIRESADDARLIRRVRWRLVAWSGGSTLVVLVVLGLALYLAAAKTHESAGMTALQSRVDDQ
ncbi:MAG TPA: hypothetical protein VET90_08705, partial [Candidatus Binatus sp.]|nr:hypothetical protein [Candidatus Binatus sp.]